jgi:hypothetical protein
MGANTSEMDSVLMLRWAWARKFNEDRTYIFIYMYVYKRETNITSFIVQKEIIITYCHSPAEV